MKNNRILRLSLDFIIAILALFEINYDFIGGRLHEIIGLIIGLLVMVHCVVNRKWFSGLLLKKGRKLMVGCVFRVVINLLLITSFCLVILSGILISGHILTSITTSNPKHWSYIHHMMVNVCGVLLLIHVLMHGKYILGFIMKGTTEQRAIIGIGGVLLTGSIIFTIVNSLIGNNNEIEPKISNIIPDATEKNTQANSVIENKNKTEPKVSNTVPDTTEKNTEGNSVKPIGESIEKRKAGQLLLTLNFNRANTVASNQYAIWIEDSKGNLVKTLYASNFTVNGGYKYRPDSLAVWVHKSNLARMSDSEADSVSGATPRAGKQTYTWDCTDENGNLVPNGEYHFYLEGTLYWSSSVLFSGSVTVGGESKDNIRVTEKYTEDTKTNKNMISSVIATYRVD